MPTTYTLEGQFLSVSLYDDTFSSYAPFLDKVHFMNPNDRDMFTVKYTNMLYTYIPHEVPKYSRVSLYDRQFFSLPFFFLFAKVDQMTPK